jgi:protein-disulfide isomerase
MTNRTPQTKKQRQEVARENARIAREAERKRRNRNRWILQGGVIVVVLAIVAIVGLVVWNGTRPPASGPLNMLSDGILFTGDGKAATATATAAIQPGAQPVATVPGTDKSVAHVVIYIDYQCPYCKQFETTNSDQLSKWVTGGIATLEVHPIAILDNSSQGTRYASRAANAMACVANFDPNSFLKVSTALFTSQPPEATSGLDNSKISSIVALGGAPGADVAKCINDETFKGWVTSATTRAHTGPLPNTAEANVAGTPLILVNGQKYTGSLTDASAFYSFVGAIATSAGSTTPTPTPTPSPTPSG